jgi:hypothetical protein
MTYDLIQIAGSGTERSKLQDIKTLLYTKLTCQVIDTVEVMHLSYSLSLEAIAQRLSFLAFDYSPLEKQYIDVNFAGPQIITSDMIPHCLDVDDSNVYLFYLNAGDEINLRLYLGTGCAQDHAKFCHFIYLQKPDDSCFLEIRRGVYSPAVLSSIYSNSA